MCVQANFADIYLRGMRDRSMRSGTELAREIQLTDIGGYIRSPIPAAQDLRVLVESHLMLSKHVKVHMTRNCFDCFGIIIV